MMIFDNNLYGIHGVYFKYCYLLFHVFKKFKFKKSTITHNLLIAKKALYQL